MTEFFDQLAKFSKRVTGAWGLPRESLWAYDRWPGKGPTAAIIHYTAGKDLASALRWFLRPKYQAKVSAHVVVPQRWTADLMGLADGLPAIQALAAPVVQCVPLDKPAWHATWMNRVAYGIELVNPGEVRALDSGELVWWPKGWTEPYEPTKGDDLLELYGSFWPRFPTEQAQAAVQVVREVVAAGFPIPSCMILGHEHVSRRKRDPGPAFSMDAFRDWVRRGDPVPARMSETWPACWPPYWDLWRMDLSPEELGEEFFRRLSSPVDPGEWSELARVALAVLGYAVGDGQSEDPEDWGPFPTGLERAGLKVFQAMMDLKADGIVGPKTWAALATRLTETRPMVDL